MNAGLSGHYFTQNFVRLLPNVFWDAGHGFTHKFVELSPKKLRGHIVGL